MSTRNLRPALIVLILVSFCQAPQAYGEYVLNGSMSGTVGWSRVPAPWTTDNNGVYIPPDIVAPGGLEEDGVHLAPGLAPSPDGGTFLVMKHNLIRELSLAAQNIHGLIPGQTYSLSFYYANAGLTFASSPIRSDPGSIRAMIAGQFLTTDNLDFAGPGLQQWHAASFEFVATQPTEQLRLTVFGSQSWIALDGVSIVPEPSGLVLLGAALAGWLPWMWRRRGHSAAASA